MSSNDLPAGMGAPQPRSRLLGAAPTAEHSSRLGRRLPPWQPAAWVARRLDLCRSDEGPLLLSCAQTVRISACCPAAALAERRQAMSRQRRGRVATGRRLLSPPNLLAPSVCALIYSTGTPVKSAA